MSLLSIDVYSGSRKQTERESIRSDVKHGEHDIRGDFVGRCVMGDEDIKGRKRTNFLHNRIARERERERERERGKCLLKLVVAYTRTYVMCYCCSLMLPLARARGLSPKDSKQTRGRRKEESCCWTQQRLLSFRKDNSICQSIKSSCIRVALCVYLCPKVCMYVYHICMR